MENTNSVSKLNVSYVHRRIGHHASHSGYNTVFEALDLKKAHSKLMGRIIKWLPMALKWRLHLLRPQAVGDEGLIPELLALPTTRSKEPGICHFIYGEDTYFYTPTWKRNKQKIIATYHYPPQLLIERVSVPVVKTLDAVILMANNQKPYFQQYLSDDKIFVVQHHVDTDFFRPSKKRPNNNNFRIVSVGGILRNMELLLSVVRELTHQLGDEKVFFDFLIPKEFNEIFKDFSNVVLHSRITDEELRTVYQNATIGFMPLEDCTANNAILEMMACGVSIVCSDVGGISDYIDTEGAVMFDPQQPLMHLVKNIVTLLNSPSKVKKMAAHNRDKAVTQFSIPRTAEKLLSVYAKIGNK
ncbi:glycosyltransferase family 4 protein [Neptunomonas qingdaonensis]|uniref:Glycosyltransferase involved in cell wall bisynthesis n=1 Tax=Neptunomonas qingdaonensis TaxID=1045558 RepID=A0A1I2MU31_9GAMM|nr:glycosyltransferase family 4 protein [Neptunomonas qingdaonensis]SFF94943.1 Glycosyltransferase involved in cell wall bisynthesis [Neptunomonas qingdaonensis]